MMDLRILDYPGWGLRLKWLAPDEVASQIELARLALDAVFLFAEGLCEPLTVSLTLVCCEAEAGYTLSQPAPPHPFWTLRQSDLPPGLEIEPTRNDERVAVADKLTPESILAYTRTALEQDCEGDARVGWEEFRFDASRARLPFPADAVAGDTMLVGYGAGVIEHALEHRNDALWVAGPLSGKAMTAPITMRVNREVSLLTFNISVYWSVWGEEGAAGRADFDRAVGRLLDNGWNLSE